MKRPIHNKKYLKNLRQDLRKKMTPAEAYLWNILKENKFENRKFRRQHSINNYIVDFYCAQDRIIIDWMARYISMLLLRIMIESEMKFYMKWGSRYCGLKIKWSLIIYNPFYRK